MKLKYIYLALCILALILTYSQVPAITKKYGYNFLPMFQEQFSTPSLRFLGFDLMITTLIGILFMLIEGLKLKMKYLWLPIVSVFAIGMSFALPLFLFMREIRLEK